MMTYDTSKLEGLGRLVGPPTPVPRLCRVAEENLEADGTIQTAQPRDCYDSTLQALCPGTPQGTPQ